MLNSPMESVTTISAPARMPARTLGSTTPKKRWRNEAPRLRAPSSSVGRSIEDSTASTARTMNGSVKRTWPTRMKTHEVRNSRHVP